MTSRDDLLRPSLAGEGASLAPPSTQVMFLTAFFGGPVAAVAVIGVGSHRLRRVTRDWPILLALLLVSLSLILWIRFADSGAGTRDWLADSLGSPGFTYVDRAMALICFAVGYWLHRQEHRNSELLGLNRPNGWYVAIPCILGGIAATTGVYAVFLAMGKLP